MRRVFLLTIAFAMTFPAVASSEKRFCQVARHVGGSDQKTFEDGVDVGDLHSIAILNSHEILWKVSWTGSDGSMKNWSIGPDLYQDRVNCPEFVQCAGSVFPCYSKCIFSPPIVLLYDSRDKKLYFSLNLNVGHGVPLAVFRADLENRKVDLLFQVGGSNLADLVFSPSESRLAFLVQLISTACAGESHLNVFDLQKGVLLNPAVKPRSKFGLRENVAYDSVEWLSETKLHLKGHTWNCPPPKVKNVPIPIDAVVTLPDN